MKKPLLILLVVVAVVVIGFFGLRTYTKSFSPEAEASFHQNGLDVVVRYSKPAKKNRHVFGREQDNALVPYGKVWRTGANEATVIEFAEDVIFAGQPVKAGAYSLWSIPDQSTWELILNSETGQWGTEYNDGKNLLSGDATLRVIPKVRELFTIYFEEVPDGANMILSWDQTEAVVPIRRP